MAGNPGRCSVIEVSEYEKTQKRQNLFYEWQRLHLKRWLDRVEKFWDNELLKEECIQILQEDMLKLWEAAPKPVRPFVAGLTLSTQKIDAQTLSLGQVSALQQSLIAVRDGALHEVDQDKAYQQLMESGISPKPSFDEDLIQLYLDEL